MLTYDMTSCIPTPSTIREAGCMAVSLNIIAYITMDRKRVIVRCHLSDKIHIAMFNGIFFSTICKKSKIMNSAYDWQRQKMYPLTCALSENSDQPSLIRNFTGRILDSQVL